MNNLEYFINRLNQLSEETGIYLSSCGCCMAINVYDKDDINIADFLDYHKEDNRYYYEEIKGGKQK